MQIEALLKKHQKLIASMARSAAGEHVFMTEDELLQEARIAVWRASEKANFPADESEQMKFIRSCVLNAFRDLGRLTQEERSVGPLSLDEELGSDSEGTPRSRHDLLGVSPNQEEHEQTARAVNKSEKLDADTQQMLKLHAEGRSMREIAKQFNVSHVAVVKRLQKARKALKKKAA